MLSQVEVRKVSTEERSFLVVAPGFWNSLPQRLDRQPYVLHLEGT